MSNKKDELHDLIEQLGFEIIELEEKITYTKGIISKARTAWKEKGEQYDKTWMQKTFYALEILKTSLRKKQMQLGSSKRKLARLQSEDIQKRYQENKSITKKRIKELEAAMTEFAEINPDMFEEHEYRGLIENQIKIFSQLLNK